MKSLIFDVDFSLSTIGSPQEIKSMLGVKPVKIYHGCGELSEKVNQIAKVQRTPADNEIFEGGEDVALVPNDKAKNLHLGCIVVDTLSALGLQERMQIRKKNAPVKGGVTQRPYPSMSQRMWGEYGDSMIDTVYSITRLDMVVVISAHIDRDRDSEGEVIEFPALKGGSKNEIQKWFDVILFCDVKEDDKNNTIFGWQTKPTPGRYAKDRKNILPKSMPQDLGEVISLYAEAGILYPKILILGESGSGKSYCLKTLSKLNKEADNGG